PLAGRRLRPSTRTTLRPALSASPAIASETDLRMSDIVAPCRIGRRPDRDAAPRRRPRFPTVRSQYAMPGGRATSIDRVATDRKYGQVDGAMAGIGLLSRRDALVSPRAQQVRRDAVRGDRSG